MNSDHRHYSTLVYELCNQYASGENRFPLTPLDAYKLLNTCKKNDADRSRLNNPRHCPPPNRPSDTNTTTKTPRLPRRTRTPAIINTSCLVTSRSSHSHNTLPGTTILLDTGATNSLFNNPSLLSNIQPRQPPLTLHTNGSPHVATQQGVYHVQTYTDHGFDMCDVHTDQEFECVCVP